MNKINKTLMLWFDVGIYGYTTSYAVALVVLTLWFDVGIYGYTTVKLS